LSVVEIIVEYFPWMAKQYGPGSESHVESAKHTLRMLKDSFGTMPADDFSVRQMTELRDAMIAKDWCRTYVNRQVGRVRDLFRWSVEMDLIPGTKWPKLLAMRNLRRGIPNVRETEAVRPAPDADIIACIERLPEVLADMLRLQRWTGARPKELMQMRWCDIRRDEATADLWYHPASHKTKHKGKSRRICLTGEAEALLMKYADLPPQEVILSPIRSERLRSAKRSAERKTPRWQSHLDRNESKRKPDSERKKPLRTTYDDTSYRQAVKRACAKAGVPVFTPYQVRHSAAARLLSKTKNPEFVRAMLGHSHVNMALHYSGIDENMAAEAARLMQE